MDKAKQIKANNDAIKKCLRQNNCTQTELANAFGIQLGSIAQWFYGDMSLTRVQNIAEYLGVTVSELIGEKETEQQQGDIITIQGKRYLITPLDN